jgi:C_GCAxxG_C_C family probable redox protein
MKTRENSMKSKIEAAIEKFQEGFNCAQSVLYCFCDDLEFEKNTALKISCGFGAGISRIGEVCGAVSGGVIVLGMKYGRGEKDGRASTEMTYAKTRELISQFTAKQGTLICRTLTNGCDLTTEEGQKKFKENDMVNRVCKPCVRSVVEIVENLIRHD